MQVYLQLPRRNSICGAAEYRENNLKTSMLRGICAENQECCEGKNFLALHSGRNGFKFAYGFKL